MNAWLELTNVRRRFGAIEALKGVDFEVRGGEVMGLVGENGAGKSTLVKIISGFDNGFRGSFRVAGKEARPGNSERAQEMGIAIAQQELSLIPTMTVAENVFLADFHAPRFATTRQLARMARPFLEEVGLAETDPAVPVNRLSVGEQHLVEVARLVAREPQLLILDEPTAALGESDSRRVIGMAKRLAARGKSIVYVSHRLDEIFELADRVTILRDGEAQAQMNVADLTVDELVTRMLGRELSAMFPPRPAPFARDDLLTVKDLWPDQVLQPISLSIRRGEILGLAGQLGSGAGEVLAAMAGAHPIRSGQISFGGETFLPASPGQAIKRKIAYCSSDRKRDGLFLGRPILENMTAPALDTISRFGFLRRGAERRKGAKLSREFTIDASRLGAEAATLSGGNQQKAALGKWLSISPRVILVDEPTRGVDVGAKAEIYKNLRGLAEAGNAIVMASTDLQEIANLPDRVITFYKGMLIGELEGEALESAAILRQITHPFGETPPDQKRR